MTWGEIHALYNIHNNAPPSSNMPPRYNIAPTQSVYFAHKDKAGEVEIDYGRWWLVPFFAKELPKGLALANCGAQLKGLLERHPHRRRKAPRHVLAPSWCSE
jgi:putative SOS response-associated peptidase YedK